MEARINRRSFVFGASCSLCGSVILPSCTQVPLTNRSQLNLYDSNLPIILMGYYNLILHFGIVKFVKKMQRKWS